MKVTLKDIADDTGFAISTISRVLRGSSKISRDTRKKVLLSAKKLEYKMPNNGEYLTKKHLNIALIASGFHEGEFYSCYYHGLNKAAKTFNVRLFLQALINYQEDLVKLLKEITAEYYDGIVLFIPELTAEDYEEIADRLSDNFPIISNSLIENPVFPTVTFDSYSGGYLAAKHLQEKGYKKQGIILGPAQRSESRFRRNGFADYISQQSGISLSWVADGDFTFESGVKAFEKYHNEKQKPDAIFASNDSMASGFIFAAKKQGYTIPGDVAVIGYDDLPASKQIQPALTSIHTDYEKLGNATIKSLLESYSKTSEMSNLLSFVPVSVSAKEST